MAETYFIKGKAPKPEGDPTECPDCGIKLKGRLDAHQGSKPCLALVLRRKQRQVAEHAGLASTGKFKPAASELGRLGAKWTVVYEDGEGEVFTEMWAAAVLAAVEWTNKHDNRLSNVRQLHVVIQALKQSPRQKKEIAALYALGGAEAAEQFLVDRGEQLEHKRWRNDKKR